MLTAYKAQLVRRRRSEGTIRLRMFYLLKFAEWFGRDLSTAAHDDFEAYLYKNPKWTTNTQQSACASLKAFYGWAHREGLLTQNPTRDLAAIVVHRRRPRLASEEAIQHAILCDSITDRAMVMLGAECGLRIAEIATLHLRNRDGMWIHVIGKGNKQRSLALSPELAAILDEIETVTMRHGWYFPGRSGIRPIHPSTAWRHITAILESNPHSLRRRAGTIVYRRSGNDIRLAQQFLGHSSTNTTELYLDITDDALTIAAGHTRLAA